MAPHRAHACPSLSVHHLDVDRNVSVIVNALISKLALIKNAVILVRDHVVGMLNVELSVTPRCAFAPVTLPVIHSSSVIPGRVSFKKCSSRGK